MLEVRETSSPDKQAARKIAKGEEQSTSDDSDMSGITMESNKDDLDMSGMTMEDSPQKPSSHQQ
ncbi:MAG: hypothetical protein OEV22_12135, partial [Deltaproteobacteria bacterium]|nr:hypothetical protein [Deltaproteobacteria bacterium]